MFEQLAISKSRKGSISLSGRISAGIKVMSRFSHTRLTMNSKLDFDIEDSKYGCEKEVNCV